MSPFGAVAAIFSLGIVATRGAAQAAANSDTAEFKLNDDEIRLDGTLRVANAAQRTCTLEATAFTLPNGKTSRLAHPRTKIVVVDDATSLHVRGDAAHAVTLAELKRGAQAVVIGKDLGRGQSLPAREIAVWDQVQNGVYQLRAAPTAVPPGKSTATIPVANGARIQTERPDLSTPVLRGTPRVPTWRDGPLLDVRIRTSMPLSTDTRTVPARIFRTVLAAPQQPPAGATAMLAMPAGLKHDSPGRLNLVHPQDLPLDTGDPLPLQLYSRSTEETQQGQPQAGTITTLTANYYTRVGRPPENLDGIPSVAVGPLRTNPGLPDTGAPIVGLPGAEPPPDTQPPNAVGDYSLTTSYAGNAAFSIGPDQDFLDPLHVTVSPTPPDLAQPLTIRWQAVPRAIGYRIVASALRHPPGAPISAVMWTSFNLAPGAVDQLPPVLDPVTAAQDGRLLPVTVTTATIPAGVLAGAQAATIYVEAVGPVRVIPGTPNVVVAVTADTTINVARP